MYAHSVGMYDVTGIGLFAYVAWRDIISRGRPGRGKGNGRRHLLFFSPSRRDA